MKAPHSPTPSDSPHLIGSIASPARRKTHSAAIGGKILRLKPGPKPLGLI